MWLDVVAGVTMPRSRQNLQSGCSSSWYFLIRAQRAVEYHLSALALKPCDSNRLRRFLPGRGQIAADAARRCEFALVYIMVAASPLDAAAKLV